VNGYAKRRDYLDGLEEILSNGVTAALIGLAAAGWKESARKSRRRETTAAIGRMR
jgi:hypothetical protein